MEVIEKGVEQDAKIIGVSGRMDGVTANEFEKQMLNWIEVGTTRFIIDLNDLDYISSAGLRSILVASKKLKEENGKILLCALKSSVKEVFEISCFNLIVPIYDSLDVALEKM